MSLTKGQRAALEAVKEGKNVFITGPGGVGKSYIVSRIIQELESIGKSVLVTASTGTAASLIGGTTCHRALRIPIKMTWLAEPSVTPDAPVYFADVVLIDEVSILRIDAFDFIYRTIEEVNRIRKTPEYLADPDSSHRDPIQVIAIGDFSQLPPVIKHPKDPKKQSLDEGVLLSDHFGFDIKSGYAFLAPGWKELNFTTIELTEVIRQSDKELIAAENAVRMGDRTALSYFKQCSRKRAFSSNDADVVHLCGKNKTAERINNRALEKLPGEEVRYYAEIIGTVEDQDKQAPDLIRLKVGAHVMMLQNTESYKNGTSGVITAVYDDAVSVQITGTGENVDVPYTTWDIETYVVKNEGGKRTIGKQKVGSFRQLPLRLAYAITIHKSQGKTFNKVVLTPEIFTYGQLYTALSRITSIKGLYIKGSLDTVEILASPEVLAFYSDAIKIRTEAAPSPATAPSPVAPAHKTKTGKAGRRKTTRHTKSKTSPEPAVSDTSGTEKIGIDFPSSLSSIMLVFAQTLDPSAHIKNSSIYIQAQYAEATRDFINSFKKT